MRTDSNLSITPSMTIFQRMDSNPSFATAGMCCVQGSGITLGTRTLTRQKGEKRIGGGLPGKRSVKVRPAGNPQQGKGDRHRPAGTYGNRPTLSPVSSYSVSLFCGCGGCCWGRKAGGRGSGPNSLRHHHEAGEFASGRTCQSWCRSML